MLNWDFFVILFPCFLLATLTACAPKVSPPVLIDQGKVQIITHSSTQMATYLKNGEPDLWLCKENVTDAVKTSSEDIFLKGSGVLTNESLGEGASTGAVALGGMSPEVLITSELLYRACELSANLNADKKLALQIYTMFLDAIDKTAAVQKEKGAGALNGNLAAPIIPPAPAPIQPAAVEGSDASSTDAGD